MVELGDTVQDVVTKQEGIVVCKCSYLSGCDRISIQPKMKKDGTVPDWHTFDITMAKLIEKKTINNLPSSVEGLKKSNKDKGGPQPAPEKW
jgi:hypothetical protein